MAVLEHSPRGDDAVSAFFHRKRCIVSRGAAIGLACPRLRKNLGRHLALKRALAPTRWFRSVTGTGPATRWRLASLDSRDCNAASTPRVVARRQSRPGHHELFSGYHTRVWFRRVNLRYRLSPARTAVTSLMDQQCHRGIGNRGYKSRHEDKHRVRTVPYRSAGYRISQRDTTI